MRLTVTAEDIALADAARGKGQRYACICPVAQAAKRIGLESPTAARSFLRWGALPDYHEASYSRKLCQQARSWDYRVGFRPGTYHLKESF